MVMLECAAACLAGDLVQLAEGVCLLRQAACPCSSDSLPAWFTLGSRSCADEHCWVVALSASAEQAKDDLIVMDVVDREAQMSTGYFCLRHQTVPLCGGCALPLQEPPLVAHHLRCMQLPLALT